MIYLFLTLLNWLIAADTEQPLLPLELLQPNDEAEYPEFPYDFRGSYTDDSESEEEQIPVYPGALQSLVPSQSDSVELTDQKIIEFVQVDLEDIVKNYDVSDSGEFIEEMIKFRRVLFKYDTIFEEAVQTRSPALKFATALKDISGATDIEFLKKFYLQKFYDDQLAKLYARLDRGRTTLLKTLSANNYRTSATQEAINSLDVYAALMNLNVNSSSKNLGKIIQFFSQPEKADIYFAKLFTEIESDEDKYELMDIGLTYLIERYRSDRSWLNKWLTYAGIKKSNTRDAIQALIRTARLLGLVVRQDYEKLLSQEDTKMIEDTLEYFLNWK